MDRQKLTEDQYKNDQTIAGVESAVHSFRATWAEQISKMTMGEVSTADAETTLTGALDAIVALAEAMRVSLTEYFAGIRPEVEEEFPPAPDEGGDGDGDGDTTEGGLARGDRHGRRPRRN